MKASSMMCLLVRNGKPPSFLVKSRIKLHTNSFKSDTANSSGTLNRFYQIDKRVISGFAIRFIESDQGALEPTVVSRKGCLDII